MFKSEPLLGARPSANTTAASTGALVDPTSYLNQSETTSTAWGVLVAADTTGDKGTPQSFRAVCAVQSELYAGRVLVRCPWTLTTQSADAASRATVKAELLVNGVVIASGQGAPRNINSANGTPFTEIIAIDIPAASPFTLLPGMTFDVRLTPTVTTQGAPGSTYTPTLRHDPATVADQLVVEFLGAAGVL